MILGYHPTCWMMYRIEQGVIVERRTMDAAQRAAALASYQHWTTAYRL